MQRDNVPFDLISIAIQFIDNGEDFEVPELMLEICSLKADLICRVLKYSPLDCSVNFFWIISAVFRVGCTQKIVKLRLGIVNIMLIFASFFFNCL